MIHATICMRVCFYMVSLFDICFFPSFSDVFFQVVCLFVCLAFQRLTVVW